MAYNRTVWQDGSRYGADSFNNIEEGILELERRLDEGDLVANGSGGNVVAQKQTVNMAKALKKLRIGKEGKSTFAFMGDSVFYAFNTIEDNPDEPRIQEDCVADDGTRLNGYYRSATTIYDTFAAAMKKVYGSDKIGIIKKTFTGLDAYRAKTMYNGTGADFTLINYGINDACGGHTNSAINGSVKPNEDGYISYVGNVELFIKSYREILEKQINSGTAVIVVGPVAQTLIGANTESEEDKGTDTDSRVVIDVYEMALRDLAKEYNCPFISGNELVKDFDNNMFIDFTHFTQKGFKTIGERLASVFIGQSPAEPVRVSGNTYLDVNPQQSNVNLIGSAILDSSSKSPNKPMVMVTPDLYATNTQRAEGGLCAAVTGFGKVCWSFYAEQDGMVVIPSFYTATQGLSAEVTLDFGAQQGKWANYWNCVDPSRIDRNHTEKSTIHISTSEMQSHEGGYRYGLHMLNSGTQPVIRIVNKCWHTIMMQIKPIHQEVYGVMPASMPDAMPGDGAMSVFGINILSDIEYKMLTK